MQIVSNVDNLHEMSKSGFFFFIGKNTKNVSTSWLLKILPSELSVKQVQNNGCLFSGFVNAKK